MVSKGISSNVLNSGLGTIVVCPEINEFLWVCNPTYRGSEPHLKLVGAHLVDLCGVLGFELEILVVPVIQQKKSFGAG